MQVLPLFDRLKRLPFGTRVFTWTVSQIAPYFGSIDANVVELRPGYARATLKKRRRVHNHLKTVHAIAMCNLAELVAGMLAEASVPADMRWIPVAMSVRYVKKATTDLVGVGHGEHLDWTKPGDVVVPIEVVNAGGDVVFTAEITLNLKSKKPS